MIYLSLRTLFGDCNEPCPFQFGIIPLQRIAADYAVFQEFLIQLFHISAVFYGKLVEEGTVEYRGEGSRFQKLLSGIAGFLAAEGSYF